MTKTRAASLCLLALLVLSSSLVFAATPRAIVHDRVAREVRDSGQSRVIVTLADDRLPQIKAFDLAQRLPAIADLRARLLRAAPRFQVKRTYATQPLLAGVVNAQSLKELESSPLVTSIYPDREMHASLTQSGPLIGAPAARNLSFNGHGMSIAIVDTGIDYKHPDFGGNPNSTFPTGKVVGGYDFVNGDGNPMDDAGHGTHVAGIAAGTDAIYRGIAPAATLVAYKVIDSTGGTFSSIVLQALDQALLDQTKYNIKVINLSLGDVTEWKSDAEFRASPYVAEAAMMDDLRAHGIVVVAAAGNEGYLEGIASPAIISSVISAGATYDANISGTISYSNCSDPSPRVDAPACYSNRGELIDVFAPGSLITSARASAYTAPAPGDPTGFLTEAGTSSASPHVAGAAACVINMLYADPTVNIGYDGVEAVRHRLKVSGVPIYDPATKVATPRIDLARAISPSSSGPDLVVTAATTTASFLSIGDTFDVEVTIRNQGNASSGACHAEIVLSANSTISPQDAVLATLDLPALMAGQPFGPVNVSATVPSIPAGLYYLGAFADSSYIVTETDETNNGLTGPSLMVSASSDVISSTMPGFLFKGQTSPVSVTMYNDGASTWTAAGGFALVPVSPAGTTRWGTTEDPLRTVGVDVPPGQSVTFDFTVTAPTTADWFPCHWQMAKDGHVFGEVATGATETLVVDDPYDGQDYSSISGHRVAYEDYSYFGISVTDLDTMNTSRLPDDIPFPINPADGYPYPPFQETLYSFHYLPSLSGPWVAWMTDDMPDPSITDFWYYQILAYNVDNPGYLPVRLNYQPTSPSEQWLPSVDGNYLVYEDYRDDSDRIRTWNSSDEADIYLADLSAVPDANREVPTYRLTTSPGDYRNPRIDGNLVVYETWRPGDLPDIYLYDLSVDTNGDGIPNWKEPVGQRPSPDPAEKQLTSTAYPELMPDIAGRTAVWLDLRRNATMADWLWNSYPLSDIYTLNVDTMVSGPIATNPLSYREQVRIDDGKVVWTDTHFGQWDAFWRNLAQGVTADIAGSFANEMTADISGRNVSYSILRDTGVFNVVVQNMLTNGSIGVHTFGDVLNDQWAWKWIEAVATNGVTTGIPIGDGHYNYAPDDQVSRAQMAVYVARAYANGATIPDVTTSSFTDVPTTGTAGWATKYIEYCYANNIVQGSPDPVNPAASIYSPNGIVNRASMAVFVARSQGWVLRTDDMTTAPKLFDDVPAGYWSGTAIKACLDHSVVKGYDPTHYQPDTVVTRDQMAVFIARAFGYTSS